MIGAVEEKLLHDPTSGDMSIRVRAKRFSAAAHPADLSFAAVVSESLTYLRQLLQPIFQPLRILGLNSSLARGLLVTFMLALSHSSLPSK